MSFFLESMPSSGAAAVLGAFRAVQRASVRGYSDAMAALVDEVKKLLGSTIRVSCLSVDTPDLVHGDAPAEAVREQARQVAWSAEPVVLPHAERGRAPSVTVFPIRSQLPGGTALAHRFPIGLVLVESAGRERSSIDTANVEQLLELVGDTLLLSLDSMGAASSHGMMSAPAFRRLTRRWVEISHASGAPVSIVTVALNGLDEVNQMIGFEAGDGVLGEAGTFLVRELPAATALSPIGGAVTAVLLAGIGAEAAHEIGQHLFRSFERQRATRFPAGVSLSMGVASLVEELPDGELLRAARAALLAARQQRLPLAVWTPSLPLRDPEDPLPDIDSVSGAEYQRILAIWRLFEALCNGAQLDQLIAATLRALLPLFRADRVALWHQVNGSWERRTTIDRSARRDPDAAPPVTREIVDLVATAAAGTDVVVRRSRAGVDMVAISLRHTSAVTGVLEVAHDSSMLRAAPSELDFLRTFARQIGRVIGEVEALAEARRKQEETADRLRKQTIELRRLVRTNSGLVGNHASMQTVFKTIEGSRTSSFPVVITGETGTGKEAVARLVHRSSNRRGPFVVVDCGAIPGSLLETELFGHEKGAFTGADSRKIGHFEEAHKGTIFLDEIGELPIELQPKLLRVLQESTVRRLGGREVISVDFRLIAATHRDLAAMVEAGTFRQDLYFRLRVLEIKLPPLRERGDDILLLALHSLRQYCVEIGRDMMTISPDAEAALRAHPWPGNVRELQNVLRRALLVAPGPELTAKDLNLEVARPSRLVRRSESPVVIDVSEVPRGAPAPEARGGTDEPPPTEVEDAVARWLWHEWAPKAATSSPPQDAIEAFLLRTCLRVTEGSISEAARLLDMHPETFGSHLDKLGDPEISRTIKHHPLGPILERSVREAGVAELLDRTLRVVLTELLVYCRGNKSDMARHLDWGRQTLGRQLRRLDVVGRAKTRALTQPAQPQRPHKQQ